MPWGMCAPRSPDAKRSQALACTALMPSYISRMRARRYGKGPRGFRSRPQGTPLSPPPRHAPALPRAQEAGPGLARLPCKCGTGDWRSSPGGVRRKRCSPAAATAAVSWVAAATARAGAGETLSAMTPRPRCLRCLQALRTVRPALRRQEASPTASPSACDQACSTRSSHLTRRSTLCHADQSGTGELPSRPGAPAVGPPAPPPPPHLV